MPVIHQNARGDELVTIRIVTPQNMTKRQREILQEFADIERTQAEKGEGSILGRVIERIKSEFDGNE